MVSRVNDHNPLGTQKIVSLMIEKSRLIGGRQGNPKLSKPNTAFLLYRRNMAERLLKRRKTTINQSINLTTLPHPPTPKPAFTS
jgi:hypothetical protein